MHPGRSCRKELSSSATSPSAHALPTVAPLHELAHHEGHACGSQEKPGVNRTAEGNAGDKPRRRSAIQEEVAETE